MIKAFELRFKIVAHDLSSAQGKLSHLAAAFLLTQVSLPLAFPGGTLPVASTATDIILSVLFKVAMLECNSHDLTEAQHKWLQIRVNRKGARRQYVRTCLLHPVLPETN